MAKDHITWINGNAYYYRWVPAEIRPYLNNKKQDRVKISLKTKDPKEAMRKADIYNGYIEGFWRNLVLTEGQDQKAAYEEAIALAKAHGFAYKDASYISKQSGINEVLSRLKTAEEHSASEHAVLGGVEKPTIKLSACADRYKSITQDLQAGRSKDQIRKWYNPKKRAMDNFIQVVGNLDFAQINRGHILDLRRWWLDRIDEEGLRGGTANKDFMHLKSIIQRISMDLQIDWNVDELFKKVNLKEEKISRLPYENKYIQDVLINSDALSGLNREARLFVLAMIDTGCRDTELIGLLPEDIILNHQVPHIIIQHNDVRGLKTKHSERKIPLVGVSLKVFLEIPGGFEHYRSGVLDNAANTVGKYFRENNLNPTDRHSLYSLRHSFKDRLREVDTPDEMKDALMGHMTRKPKYGSGYTLEAKQRWLNKIVF